MPPCRQYRARLADARRALEQEQRTAPGDRVAQAPVDQGKGGVAFEKRLPAIHRRHRRQSYRRQNSSVHLRKKHVACHGAALIRLRRSWPHNDSTQNQNQGGTDD